MFLFYAWSAFFPEYKGYEKFFAWSASVLKYKKCFWKKYKKLFRVIFFWNWGWKVHQVAAIFTTVAIYGHNPVRSDRNRKDGCVGRYVRNNICFNMNVFWATYKYLHWFIFSKNKTNFNSYFMWAPESTQIFRTDHYRIWRTKSKWWKLFSWRLY